MAVGTCTIEFLLKDRASQKWHAFTEEFVVIKGKRTFIVGMPFCTPSNRPHVSINLSDESLSLEHCGTCISTALLSGEPALAAQVQLVMNAKCPLIFTPPVGAGSRSGTVLDDRLGLSGRSCQR